MWTSFIYISSTIGQKYIYLYRIMENIFLEVFLARNEYCPEYKRNILAFNFGGTFLRS